MIGVLADPGDAKVVAEFFELFKTPWEFYRPSGRYEVLLSTVESSVDHGAARLVLQYVGRRMGSDGSRPVRSLPRNGTGRFFDHPTGRIPIYGECVVFGGSADAHPILDSDARQPGGYLVENDGTFVARLGYDLFEEVRILLTSGQPIGNAGIPTLDLHVAILRELMIRSRSVFVEIPPVPKGYRFIAALTHDVDHPSIRLHKLDHTLFGFLFRAVVGSVWNVATGRAGLTQLATNWLAVMKLPLVYLRLAKDFWQGFVDYPKLEPGRRSTFFIIPFQNQPGRKGKAPAPHLRSSSYGAKRIAPEIAELQAKRCEIAVHGIDAWCDQTAARNELAEIRNLTGSREIGIRMHWLYFDQNSAELLDRAGADYDSTVGYNETVGYRAGTAQAYRPLAAKRLLELPLVVMDTALFYPSHLNLTRSEARRRLVPLVDHAETSGGCLTVNWHDRSLAPERLWGKFYQDFVAELEHRGAWVTTAGDAVAWFRKRRSARFDHGEEKQNAGASETDHGELVETPGLEFRGSPERLITDDQVYIPANILKGQAE